MKPYLSYILLAWISFCILSCSSTRHLPEGETLYTGIRKIQYKKVGEDRKDWRINNMAEKTKNAVFILWVNPNGSFMGLPNVRTIPIRLYIYNFFIHPGIAAFHIG